MRNGLEAAVKTPIQSLVSQAGFKTRAALWVAREPRKSQKEGQEDQGTLKQLGRVPPEFVYLSLVLPALLLALP